MYVDEIDLSDADAVYIVSPINGEFDSHINWDVDRKCTIYHWNLERPGSGSLADYAVSNRRRIHENKLDAIIVSDRRLANDCGAYHYYMPVGGHIGLGEPGEHDTYDFIHLMAPSHRRIQLGLFDYPIARATLCGRSIAPNGWGWARHRALQQSKYMLNVHQDDHLYIEPLRFVLAACYGLPIVSEVVYDPFPYTNLLQINMDSICVELTSAMRNYRTHKDVGEWYRTLFTQEFTFSKCVSEYIENLPRNV